MAEARLPADRKQQHINNDEINETVYGFITENSPIDLIRFWLQTTTGELYFDYKIKQDQQGQWQVWAMVWIQAHFSLPILPLNHRNKLFIPPYFLPTGGIFLSFFLTDQKQTVFKTDIADFTTALLILKNSLCQPGKAVCRPNLQTDSLWQGCHPSQRIKGWQAILLFFDLK